MGDVRGVGWWGQGAADQMPARVPGRDPRPLEGDDGARDFVQWLPRQGPGQSLRLFPFARPAEHVETAQAGIGRGTVGPQVGNLTAQRGGGWFVSRVIGGPGGLQDRLGPPARIAEGIAQGGMA